MAPFGSARHWDPGSAIIRPQRRADELTDQLMVPAFPALDDDGAAALLAGLAEMKAQLPVP